MIMPYRCNCFVLSRKMQKYFMKECFALSRKLFYPYHYILLRDTEYARIKGFQKWRTQVILQSENYDHFGVKRYPKKFYFSRISEFYRENLCKNKLWEWLYPWEILVFVISLLWHKPSIFPNLYIYLEGSPPALYIYSFSKIKYFVVCTWKVHLRCVYNFLKIKPWDRDYD